MHVVGESSISSAAPRVCRRQRHLLPLIAIVTVLPHFSIAAIANDLAHATEEAKADFLCQYLRVDQGGVA
jgi:hypothetical protein